MLIKRYELNADDNYISNNKMTTVLENFSKHEENAYTGVAMNDLYNSLSGASQESNRDIYNKLNTEKFLKGLHKTNHRERKFTRSRSAFISPVRYGLKLVQSFLIYVN